ncbi:MAG: hypothetical protein JWN71_3566 [Xanthobacteraceae bacterium]|nr:hypothetical protein [Xanthobacteraceae bacterium]
MRFVTLAFLLLVATTAARAADVGAIVTLFDTVCLNSQDALATAEQKSKLLGWRKNEKLSGQQSAFPVQSIMTHTWDLREATFAGSLSISSVQDENGSAQLCGISLRQFDDSTLEDALATKLNLSAPAVRRVKGNEVHTTWSIQEPGVGIQYFSQRLIDGPSIQIVIGKRQAKAQ